MTQQNLRKNQKLAKYIMLSPKEKRELCRAFLKNWVETGSQVKATYAMRTSGFKTRRGTFYSNPTLQSHFRRWIVFDPTDAEQCFTSPEFCGLSLSHDEFERMRVENAFALFRTRRDKIWIWAETYGLKEKYFKALTNYVNDGFEDEFSGDNASEPMDS